MDFARIEALQNRIAGLYSAIQKMKDRRESLLGEESHAREAQEKLRAAIDAASEKAKALGTLGMRPEFCEELLAPVRNAPDISGISGVVSNEVSKADEDIADANRQINMASQEKAQLETEAV